MGGAPSYEISDNENVPGSILDNALTNIVNFLSASKKPPKNADQKEKFSNASPLKIKQSVPIKIQNDKNNK